MSDVYCVFFEGRCEDVCCKSCPKKDHIHYYGETNRRLNTLPDAVQHPAHYSRWAMEPIDFIAVNNLPWWLANVIKYTMRFDAKDGIQDLYKARSYLEMKIRELEGHKRFWEKPVAEERKLNVNAAPTTS